MTAALHQLVKSYERSKVRRVAAVYNDTPPHLRHKVHLAFGICRKLPTQYQNYSNRYP